MYRRPGAAKNSNPTHGFQALRSNQAQVKSSSGTIKFGNQRPERSVVANPSLKNDSQAVSKHRSKLSSKSAAKSNSRQKHFSEP